MVNGDFLNTVTGDTCGCCQFASDGSLAAFECADRRKIFTIREQAVLGRIRENSEEARKLKHCIRQLHDDDGPMDPRERERARERLETLRSVRAELEMERIAAAEERMRILGHA